MQIALYFNSYPFANIYKETFLFSGKYYLKFIYKLNIRTEYNVFIMILTFFIFIFSKIVIHIPLNSFI